MKNCLVLDTNPGNWPKKYNRFFLGYWCLENLKNSFKNLSSFKILDHEQEKNDNEIDNYVKLQDDICKNIVKDITKQLNKLHNKKYSEKFWTIIVGPWLKIFVGIILERYSSLEYALKKKKFDKIILANYKNFDFSCENLTDFENKISKNYNSWNLYFYTRIFEYLKININIKKIKIKNNIINNEESSPKLQIKRILSKLLRIFMREKDSFIFDNPFSFYKNIKFYYFLKLIPQINIEPSYVRVKSDKNLRGKLNFKKSKAHKIEKFIRHILPEIIPTDSVENFSNLDKICENINWPKKPKLIFALHSYQQNEIFKLWAAKKIEHNSLYVVAQHGGSYFTSKHVTYLPEFTTCDKFISWGNPKIKKCLPLFNFRTIGQVNVNNRKKIFFFSSWMHNMRARSFPEYKVNLDANITMSNVMRGIDVKYKKEIIIRINKFNLKKLENKIIKEILFKKKDEYKIDDFQFSKKEIYEKSKIVIHLSNSTGFLETLAANVPSVIIIPNLNWIQKNAKKDFVELKKAKILFFDPKKLSGHINKYYEDTDKWWNSKMTISARNKFIKKYSMPIPEDSEKKFAEVLKKLG